MHVKINIHDKHKLSFIRVTLVSIKNIVKLLHVYEINFEKKKY